MLPYKYFLLWPEEPGGFFEADIYDAGIFRPIDRYHSLVPKTIFFRVIQDLGPFLESPFWLIIRKRLIFEIMVPILSSHFFNSYQMAYFTFFGGGGGGGGGGGEVFENFSYYCNPVPPFF